MKRIALVLALTAAGCGGSSPVTPSAPPTPPSPVYPNMLGGWGGTQADTWVATDGTQPGGRTCNEAWLITSQTGADFSGAFQRTAGSSDVCARSGNIFGTVLPDGSIGFRHTDSGVAGGCQYISGDQSYRGVLSSAGNVTAGAIIFGRCPFGRGTIDLRFTTSVTVSRR